MKTSSLIIGGAISILCYILSVVGSGCAQIGMPTGGPRDSTPPVLLNASPPERSLHFSSGKIVLTFDEYVHLQDIQKNLLASPEPKLPPNVTSKLKTVTIKIRDTLQPNTTYSFQLGDAIQDIDENNPVHNFTYVFSTGSYIDSLTFDGRVIVAETGKPDSTLLAVLYRNLDDSAVYKEKPTYVTRLDSSGNYHFRYLAPGTYRLYALSSEGGQKMYNNPSQLFAFADSAVRITGNIAPVTLYAYAQEKNKKPVSGISAAPGKPGAKVLKFGTSFSEQAQDLLSPVTLAFHIPLKNVDLQKIRLTDTLFHPIPSAAVSMDTSKTVISIATNWKEDTKYKLLIEKDFAEDTAGDKLLKADTVTFATRRESDYGSLRLNFVHLDKIEHPVLQLIKDKKVVDSFPLTSPLFVRKMYYPGTYEIRILHDTNGNGTWDPGNFQMKKQPEIVTPVPKKLNIRADWDNESDIIL